MISRYLTKSRFQMAMQCPTKLYYVGKPEYANQKIDDPFLLSLAEGGFQVGALARCHFPNGHNIETNEITETLCATKELMKRQNIVIFEAAFLYQNLFAQVDILVKRGNTLQLIEVKSKSFDSANDGFLTRSGSIASAWKEYLYDVAFQKHVLNSALPGYKIDVYLMMPDKAASCPLDGLNQKFRIIKDEWGRKGVRVSDNLRPEEIEPSILTCLNVNEYCDVIFENSIEYEGEKIIFPHYVKWLADCYVRDEKIMSYPSSACKGCEYQATKEEESAGLKSGFRECWKESLGWEDDDFDGQTVLDIWDFRKKDEFLRNGRVKLDDISIGDISPESDGKPGISASQRRWLQVEKYQNRDRSHWIDIENLSEEMSTWVYPLHFIDFETSMVAIPFYKGRHPYEGIAFQFSHHIVNEDGTIEHKGQYLNVEPGVFPNYNFIRALKNELDMDRGSIFRYSPHENTYLNMIRTQLLQDPHDISDRYELSAFIESITKSTRNSTEEWEGKRCMIDMWELVKRYYYDPAMRGYNSIKYVLPAILNGSSYLQGKYTKPIYGAKNGIPSLNYKDWKWIEYDTEGSVIDPYKLLPKMFRDFTDKENQLLSEDDEIRNGGAALTAYARMQFEDMSDYERSEIINSLLKYCELDTLAMVMIYEGWRDLIYSN